MAALASLMLADAPGMRNVLQVMAFVSWNEHLLAPQGAAERSVQQVGRLSGLAWPGRTSAPHSLLCGPPLGAAVLHAFAPPTVQHPHPANIKSAACRSRAAWWMNACAPCTCWPARAGSVRPGMRLCWNTCKMLAEAAAMLAATLAAVTTVVAAAASPAAAAAMPALQVQNRAAHASC